MRKRRPFDNLYVDYGAIEEATSLSDPCLRVGLCPKAGNDMTTCYDCPDRRCPVGVKIRDLLEKETAPDATPAQVPVEAVQEMPLMDIERQVFTEAVNSRIPIRKMLKIYDLLPTHPLRYTRRDAKDFLYGYLERHPDPDAKQALDEALEKEAKADYETLKKQVLIGKDIGWTEDASEAAAAQMFRDRDRVTGKSALAYVYELKQRYGPYTGESPVPMTAEKAEDSYKDDVDTAYEELLDELDSLREEYAAREEQIHAHMDLISQMKTAYQGMIVAIRESERKIGLFPEADRTPLKQLLTDTEAIITEDTEDLDDSLGDSPNDEKSQAGF